MELGFILPQQLTLNPLRLILLAFILAPYYFLFPLTFLYLATFFIFRNFTGRLKTTKKFPFISISLIIRFPTPERPIMISSKDLSPLTT